MLLLCPDIQVSLSSREALIKLVISAKVEIHSIHAQWITGSPLSWDDRFRGSLSIDYADLISLSQSGSLTSELTMTQELIANMLGVRREGVTEAAGELQRTGLIYYGRGRITVINRPGLEANTLAAHYLGVGCLIGRITPAGGGFRAATVKNRDIPAAI